MKKRALLLPFTPVALAAAAGCGAQCPPTESASSAAAEAPGGADADAMFAPIDVPSTLEVTSTAFADGAPIPEAHVFAGFGCNGGNASPPLSWSNEPEGTQGFALVVHDPDAPTGVGFFHWVALDIPAGVTSLPAGWSGSAPEGVVQGHTDFGATGYGGPCPPPGPAHRYHFTVYALDVPTLGLGDTATGALARFSIAQHALAKGRLTGTYARD